jgi:hypothetical protein
MANDHEEDGSEIGDPPSAIRHLRWRDEILQVMYWMTGEGFGRAFAASELQRFLDADATVLTENLEQMVAGGFVERVSENTYALTPWGRQEGGRRFADEFSSMLKPGHYECDEPDCDCHNPEFIGEVCKNLSPAHQAQDRS